MKTPKFWYAPPSFLSRALSPLGMLYGLIASARAQLIAPEHFSIPVICVGNIVAGGAGKTPTVLALVEILKNLDFKPAIVSRGYGGAIKAATRVDPTIHTASDVGDEPLLLSRAAPCWIGADRLETTVRASQDASVIVMDDGFQNPLIGKNVSFLVIDGNSGIGNGCLLPAGPLRETLESGDERASAIIFIGEDKQNLIHRFKKPVYRASFQAEIPSSISKDTPVLAFSGIARPEKFFDTCTALGLTLIGTRNYADHHAFTSEEIVSLRQQSQVQGAHLLTTEKDFVRLQENQKAGIAALPVKLIFDQLSQSSIETLLFKLRKN